MAQRSRSRQTAEKLSNEGTQTSTISSSIDLGIARRLKTDQGFLDRYLRTWAATEVASGLRAMRLMRKKRQKDLAFLAETGQSAISRIEKRDYDAWTFKTLLTIAVILKARLDIRFVPVEDVIGQLEAHERGATSDRTEAKFFEGREATATYIEIEQLGGTPRPWETREAGSTDEYVEYVEIH